MRRKQNEENTDMDNNIQQIPDALQKMSMKIYE